MNSKNTIPKEIDIEAFKKSLKYKITHLNKTLSEELSLHQTIKLKSNISKCRALKNFQEYLEKQLNKIQYIHQSDLLYVIEDDIGKLDNDLKNFLANPKQKKKNDIKDIQLKFRARNLILKIKYKSLLKHMNTMILFLIYKVNIISSKESLYNQETLETMLFKPRKNLGPKAGFAILRIKSKRLAALIFRRESEAEIIQKFITEYNNLNNASPDKDKARTDKLKNIALKFRKKLQVQIKEG